MRKRKPATAPQTQDKKVQAAESCGPILRSSIWRGDDEDETWLSRVRSAGAGALGSSPRKSARKTRDGKSSEKIGPSDRYAGAGPDGDEPRAAFRCRRR